MAKAAAINLNDSFLPPAHIHGPATLNESLPSLGSPAGPGPGSATQGAASRLSGHVAAVANAKERAASNGAASGRRGAAQGAASAGGPGGHPLAAAFLPAPAASLPYDVLNGGQHNPRLPPLMHGYSAGPGGRPTASPPGASGLGATGYGITAGPGPHANTEPAITQQPASVFPGPAPASHPWQPKRKPPSAFMRNNPLRHQLDAHRPRAGSATGGAAGLAVVASGVAAADLAALGDEAVAAAMAAIAQRQAGELGAAAGGGGDGGGGWGTGELGVTGAPWGVSSVSDLEALDSILDQLVVVDARMRRALLKGPLISFETVVPEHLLGPERQQQQQQRRPEDDKDRTFLTSVRGIAEEGAAQEEEAAPEASAPAPPAAPEPSAQEDAVAAAAIWNAAMAAAAAAGDGGEIRDTPMFRASIPNTGMHPTFTRAYLASKAAPKLQLTPPPPPATAEHLLRTRPPPFIAAPSYDALCSQIRDVQRQYTCGTMRTVASAAPGGGAAGAAAAGATAGPGAGTVGAAAAAAATGAAGAPGPVSTTNQYISGLDGPMLNEVVAHQDLPISLERVRPTFVALKQKPRAASSPRRRPASPGREGAGRASADGGGPEEGLAGRRL